MWPSHLPVEVFFYCFSPSLRKHDVKDQILSSLGNVNDRLINFAESFWSRKQSTRWRFGRQLCCISPLHDLQNLAIKLILQPTHKQAFAGPESTRVELHLWVPGHTASRRKVPKAKSCRERYLLCASAPLPDKMWAGGLTTQSAQRLVVPPG